MSPRPAARALRALDQMTAALEELSSMVPHLPTEAREVLADSSLHDVDASIAGLERMRRQLAEMMTERRR